MTKKRLFLYHPDNPDKSFDVYIDKNPDDTIPSKSWNDYTKQRNILINEFGRWG